MTNEDAKHWINICVQDYIRYYDDYHEEILEARDMMFKALEAQPMDVVSRQAVINTIFYKSDNSCDVVLSTDLMDRIKQLPSVTPQRPKGKWIEIPVENDIVPVVFKCSECGMRVVNPYKYCPNCGSYNGGEEDEDSD